MSIQYRFLGRSENRPSLKVQCLNQATEENGALRFYGFFEKPRGLLEPNVRSRNEIRAHSSSLSSKAVPE